LEKIVLMIILFVGYLLITDITTDKFFISANSGGKISPRPEVRSCKIA
jgi:hypothetical protein